MFLHRDSEVKERTRRLWNFAKASKRFFHLIERQV